MDSKLREALYMLESYNGIFRQLWELGRIHFTDKIPTACIEFDQEGNELRFCFNPELYQKINAYELAFIIGHECMHVMLYHGKRIKNNTDFQEKPEAFNIAADIAIHEIMFNDFGFDREEIKTLEPCTVDTIFTKRGIQADNGKTTEYYFNKLLENGVVKYVPMDIHNFGDGFSEAAERALKKAFGRLTNTEKKELQNKLKELQGNKDIEDKDDADGKGNKKEKEANPGGQQAGTHRGGSVYDAPIIEYPKKKWELIVKELTQAFLVSDRTDWTKTQRRMKTLPKKMFLPSYMDLEVKKKKIWMYLDTSGSCISLASRFLSAAAALPEKFFDVRVFCFDTDIYETDLKSQKVYGGGGTAFDIIQHHITKQNGNPDFVFVTTDGYGNKVVPTDPTKWHIFLTTEAKDCFPPNCVFHAFSEFE